MVQAVRSLSPKQILERIQRHRHAIAVLALMRAKKAVQAQIRARGERISNYTAKEISLLANDHFAQHREELINKATQDVASWPEFNRYVCANIETAAQNQSEPNSTTSAVQISGAE